MLQAHAVECIRGDRTLFTGLNLSLDAGQLLHLHGPNGSGKTSLLRMLCGLVAPAAGDITWNGLPIRAQRDEFNACLTYIGHHGGIKEELSALENLQFAAALSGNPVSEAAALEALDAMGLRGREDLPAKVLSQGQKRRVALARLHLSRAALWILDEPFVALDKAAVGELESLIGRHLDRGGSAIMTTHQSVAFTGRELAHLHLGHHA